ncbi:HAAS signaling domain-containing protein [Actinokineospora bangkokensis]|uniref:Proline-rich protein n=1 Tax=Actinokineospora bangkokensis TaxID=1193682 RepID=A0A1Q9LHS2_9PSEU|nr:hypothetical protein [Actinokineospora bangkokensis]OLR91566.1 hypothetical protein BJP25_25720 [Actinokineospora bangkokensis]
MNGDVVNGGTDTRPEVADYVAGVRAALSDLPAEELGDVMEDVERNVFEVHAETGSVSGLTARLGAPEAYADELRAAGGYPPRAAARPGAQGVLARAVAWLTGVAMGLALLSGAVATHEEEVSFGLLVLAVLALVPPLWLVVSRRVRRADVVELGEYQALVRAGRSLAGGLPPAFVGYLRGLRPAWWLARVVLLGLALVAALSARSAGVLLVAVVAVVTVWAGLRVREDGRFAPLVLTANAFAVGVLIGLLATLVEGSGNRSSPVAYATAPGVYVDGRYVENFYAVDAQGKLVERFYLYDDEGRPIALPHRTCSDGVVDRALDNRFPRPEVDYRSGRCVESTSAPFVPPLVPSASTAPSTTATTAPTSAPTTAPTSTPPTSAPAVTTTTR